MTRQHAIQRVARSASGAWHFVERFPVRLRMAMKELNRPAPTPDSNPTAAQRQDDLVVFYSQYERLVELLCDASNYGPDGHLESEYSQLRKWMHEHYPNIRLFVVAYLRMECVDARQSMNWHSDFGDAFEALFAAPSLDEFLRLDDGEMIWRIERTRSAINLYGEHLRQLALQEK